MSSKTRKQQGNDFDEEQIADWLSTQPEFFVRHPDCLSSMELPVDSGAAISLHQYQVRVLRDEKAQLKQKLGLLVKNVKTNHKIHSDLLGLAGSMIELAKKGESMAAQLALIKKHFALFDVNLFTKAQHADQFEQLHSILGKHDAVCDNAPDTVLRKVFFTDTAPGSLSIAIVPVKQGKKVCACMLLAADDDERFKPGMGGEFLKLLAHLVSSLLDEA